MSSEAEESALYGLKEASKYMVKNTQSPVENTNNAGLRKMKREIVAKKRESGYTERQEARGERPHEE